MHTTADIPERATGTDSLTAFTPAGENPDWLASAVLNACPDGIVVFDNTRRIIFANPPASEILSRIGVRAGQSLAEIYVAIRLFDSAGQKPVSIAREPVARALLGETVDRTEYLVRSMQASESLWVECGARPLRGNSGKASGEIRGAIAVVRDVTDRKRRELESRSADQIRDFIYRGNLAGIIHTTIDGRILDCNEAIVRMFGYDSTEELKSLHAQQLYADPSDRDRMLRLIHGPRRLNEFELFFRRRDNTRGWALVNVCVLEAQPGQVGGRFLSTLIDITERKLWEETLRQSEQRFAAFMRNLPGIAFIKDLTGRYVYFNDAVRRLFQKDPADINGKRDEEIWPAADAAQYRETDATVIDTGSPLEVVQQVAHADGPHSWLVYKFPIMEDGRTALVGGIGIDITQRLAMESQLTQTGKMEALGRLASGVAHDFNNLLTVISGYGQLALEALGNTSHDKLATYLHEILASARRAAGLTGQLLAFSRRQSPQPAVLDLAELLGNLEKLLQRMIGEHVELTVHCGRERVLIRADAQQIEQVIMNLAVNARDAMPLGGALEIRCSLLATPIERTGHEPLGVVVEVRDTGIGMEESVKTHIFEPFFTSKAKARGTGLGLSTAYAIVTGAGGTINVESEPGAGTTFKIYFPLATGEAASGSPGITGGAAAGLETVLLVEDDEGVRSLVTAILERLGYKVLVADSGQAAIEIWRRQEGRVDILLTDMIMPHMSGSELARTLRGMRADLKVLFMSGYTDDMIESQGIQGSETHLIAKPFTAEELGRRLRSVLDS